MVEKTRTTWVLDKIEIVIDDVKGLGTFIELEATGHYDHPKQGKKYLYEILKKLNADTGKEDIRGYPYRLLEKNGSTSF